MGESGSEGGDGVGAEVVFVVWCLYLPIGWSIQVDYMFFFGF
jgi:hypothetical protein